MIDLKEVLVANGLSMLAMWYLLGCRRKNRESAHTEDKIYDAMCMVNFGGALFETISFLIDGVSFAGAVPLNFVANSFCFLGTVSIGFLWSLYTDLYVYRNYRRSARRARLLAIPWLIEAGAVVVNLFGTGVLFSISANNVYERGAGAIIGYISLMIYFAYSVALVMRSRKDGNNLHFFPVQYFVGPCIAGVLVQFLFYGITLSWVSVTMALVFVQMQNYAENLYRDELSGLFNRRFLDRMLEGNGGMSKNGLFGIMLDINDFKNINDSFGHSVGDHAICLLGDTLFRVIPEEAKAIRYAGDEFIVLLPESSEEQATQTMSEIRAALAAINESGSEPFRLHASMGHAQFAEGDDAEAFLRNMDARMYEEKRAFHKGA